MEEIVPTEKCPSLGELACKCMVEMAKQQKLTLDLENFPPSMGKDIWKHCELMDIITLAGNTNQLEWFSQNVNITVSSFKVHLPKNEHSRKEVEISLQCDDKIPIHWSFHEDPFNERDSFMLKIGDQSIRTQFHGDILHHKLFKSHFINEIDEIHLVDWLCKLFHRGVSAMIIDGGSSNFKEIKTWPRVKEPECLTVKNCDDSEFLQSILTERHEKNFKTFLVACEFVDPLQIPIDCFKNVDNRKTAFNLTNFNVEQLIQFAKCLRDKLNILWITIPELTNQDLVTFKNALRLSDRERSLNATHYLCFHDGLNAPTTKYKLFYKARRHSRAIVFRFYEKSPGVFNRLTIDSRLIIR